MPRKAVRDLPRSGVAYLQRPSISTVGQGTFAGLRRICLLEGPAGGRRLFVQKFPWSGNTSLSVPPDDLGKPKPEMITVKAALLSLAMLGAIAIGGIGIYAADASSGHAVVDGYGVGAIRR